MHGRIVHEAVMIVRGLPFNVQVFDTNGNYYAYTRFSANDGMIIDGRSVEEVMALCSASLPLAVSCRGRHLALAPLDDPAKCIPSSNRGRPDGPPRNQHTRRNTIMCQGNNSEAKQSTCKGACAGSGPKLSEQELQKQRSQCHGEAGEQDPSEAPTA
jgi:hypothetical protein